MSKITWKPIKGYEGKYAVSNLGQVMSFPNKQHASEIILKPYDKFGYLTVSLGKKTISVAFLVAQAFLPNPKGYRYVKCVDGNIHNVRVDNLEWVETIEEADGLKPINLSDLPAIVKNKDISPDKLNISEENDYFVIVQSFSKTKIQKAI